MGSFSFMKTSGMSVQMASVEEGFRADLTLEGSHFIVDTSDVALNMTRPCKASVAKAAIVRP